MSYDKFEFPTQLDNVLMLFTRGNQIAMSHDITFRRSTRGFVITIPTATRGRLRHLAVTGWAIEQIFEKRGLFVPVIDTTLINLHVTCGSSHNIFYMRHTFMTGEKINLRFILFAYDLDQGVGFYEYEI